MEILFGILIGFIPTFVYMKVKVHKLQDKLVDKNTIISVLQKHYPKTKFSKDKRKKS
jgi:hypothetical protein